MYAEPYSSLLIDPHAYSNTDTLYSNSPLVHRVKINYRGVSYTTLVLGFEYERPCLILNSGNQQSFLRSRGLEVGATWTHSSVTLPAPTGQVRAFSKNTMNEIGQRSNRNIHFRNEIERFLIESSGGHPRARPNQLSINPAIKPNELRLLSS